MKVILLGCSAGQALPGLSDRFHPVASVNRSGEVPIPTLPSVPTVRQAMRTNPDAALLLGSFEEIHPDSELETDVLNALESGLDVYCSHPDRLAGRECFRHASKLTGARFLGAA